MTNNQTDSRLISHKRLSSIAQTIKLLSILNVCLLTSVYAQTVVEVPQASQRATIRQRIGLTDIEVDYSRPAVNGRKIWGNIVPYGFTSPTVDGKDQAPWKTGANLNTTISFTHDVVVMGNPVKAGKYGFFVAVHEDYSATVVLSKTHQAYGQYFYRQEEDVMRATVTARSCVFNELLTFSFDEVKSRHTVLSLRWETREIPIRIDVDVHEVVKANLIEQLKQPATFTWQGRVQAARYMIDNNVHLELALQWVEEALAGSPGDELLTGERNFSTLTTKYHVLNALNREQEAQHYLDEALNNPGNVMAERVVSFARNLLNKKRKEDAQRVFEWAFKKWPSSWETKHGMARMFSSNGKFKEALKLEKEVLAIAPEEEKVAIAANIKLLESNQDFN
jgi:tetratricopeptide (TPR) repeat protein